MSVLSTENLANCENLENIGVIFHDPVYSYRPGLIVHKDKKDNKGDKDKKDDKGKDKDKPSDKDGKNKDKSKEDGKPKPLPGGISQQRLENLLEAVNNEEKKIQDKVNAKKVQGKPIKTEKDW